MDELILFIKIFFKCIVFNPALLIIYASGLLIKSLSCFNKKWKY